MPNPRPIAPGPGRPRGHGNARPTRDELRHFRSLLRNAANQGNVNAAGWLLTVDALERQQPGRGAE